MHNIALTAVTFEKLKRLNDSIAFVEVTRPSGDFIKAKNLPEYQKVKGFIEDLIKISGQIDAFRKKYPQVYS